MCAEAFRNRRRPTGKLFFKTPSNEAGANNRRTAQSFAPSFEILRQNLDNQDFQALVELCARNIGMRSVILQPNRLSHSESGHILKLNLSSLPLVDLTPLESMPELDSIDISMTSIGDLTVFQNCSKLSRLWLDDTPVFDLSPLAGKNLIVLMLNRAQISTLSDLRMLPTVEYLGVEGTLVKSLEPIRNLHKLKQLNIRSTKIFDLEPITHCGDLQTLIGAQCQIRSLEPIRKLLELVKIDLGWNCITDCSPVGALGNLREINLAGNPLNPRLAAEMVMQLKKLHGDKIRIAL